MKVEKIKDKKIKNTKSWSLFVGCKFGCGYCEASYKRVMKWNGRTQHCYKCVNYEPHTHPERLNRKPSDKVLWIASQGDISFCDDAFAKRIFEAMRQDNKNGRVFLLQSKNPGYFAKFLSDLPANTVLMVTIESNRDYPSVSKAPPVKQRFEDFLKLDWPRKAFVMEPILDFDEDVILDWMSRVNPEAVFIGKETQGKCKLVEPSALKVENLHKSLQGLGFRTYDKARYKYKDVF